MTAEFIEWKDIRHDYDTADGPVEALSGIAASFRHEEFVSILGPSGCGKSTLLLLTAGLLRPTAGQVRIDGHEITEPYEDMSLAFQQDLLLEWRTCLDNVLFPAEIQKMDLKQARRRALELFDQTGLAGFEDRWPRELSGGMRQRVSLCRALLPDPHLLLMDEPFGALDALTRRQMTFDLEQLFLESKKTVLFVTHDIQEAVLLGDRVLVLSERPGRIVADERIDVPRPRGGNEEVGEALRSYAAEIEQIFEGLGILRRSRPRR